MPCVPAPIALAHAATATATSRSAAQSRTRRATEGAAGSLRRCGLDMMARPPTIHSMEIASPAHTHSLSTHTHTHSPSASPSAAATRSAARCLKTAASSRTIGSARVGRSRPRLRLRRRWWPPTPLSPPHAPSPSSRAPRLTAASATSSSASRRETVRRGHGVPNEGSLASGLAHALARVAAHVLYTECSSLSRPASQPAY